MRQFFITSLFALTLGVVGAYAQHGEIGVAVGGSLYRNPSISNGGQQVTAGLNNGFAGSAWLGEQMYKYVGGEIHYTYETNQFNLSGNGANVGFGGDSHSIGYDLHFHLTPRTSRFRPYVFGGGGIKYYQGTGTESATQPLSRYALLTKENELRPMVSFGGGIKFGITEHLFMRAEFRDMMTSFPTKILTPNAGSTTPNFLHNFVPNAGISYVF